MNKNKNIARLISLAAKTRKRAWAPYSEFKVGAALLAKNGRIYTGCNVENATFGATICAERTAVTKAVSEGARTYIMIAIVTDTKEPCPPCGICRQVLAEFSPNMTVVMATTKGKYKTALLKDLLPEMFELRK